MIPNSITDRLESTDRGVSPVIGVILMVAITVILAAVIGTFVLDLGQSAGNSAPSASLTVSPEQSTDSFEISHKGGDSLQTASTTIQITNESNGDVTSFAASGDVTFGVGQTANVSLDATAGNAEVNIGGTDEYGDPSPNDVQDVDPGIQYSVQLIDTESQRVIFETTVTA